MILSLFHVLFVAPLFLYVGIKGTSIPTWMYSLFVAMALGIFGYHAYRAVMKWSKGQSAWINWIHILVVVPLLAWIGLHKESTPRKAFELLLMTGFAALGYHGYYLFV